MERMSGLMLVLARLVFRHYEFLVIFGYTVFSSFQTSADLG